MKRISTDNAGGFRRAALAAAASCAMATCAPAFAQTIDGDHIDGDHVISANTTLEEDLTVTGTLTLENSATVDLNGHKLTVGGFACSSQNIVVNGDFETDPSWGELSGSSWSYYKESQSYNPPGMGSVWEGWTNPTHGGGIARTSSAFALNTLDVNGKYCAFLHTNAGSSGASTKGRHISQQLTIPAAGLYLWSFRYAQRAGAHGALPFNLNLIHGSTTNTLRSATPTSQTTFSTASGTVKVAESGTYTLQFIATTYGDLGALFDDVVLRQVAAITDTSTGAPGELRIDVPENTTFTNDSVVVSGNLNFVKDGAGTYTCATEGLMAYRGGTCVEVGTYLCGLDGSKGPFGPTYSRGNILVNGNFNADPSTGAISSGYQYYNGGSGPAFTWSGWGASTMGSGLAKQNSTFVGNLSVGTYAAFLHGPGGSGRCIAQELSGVSAGIYSLSFKYAPSRAACQFDCLLEGEGTTLTLFTGKSASIASGKTWTTTPWTTSSYTVDVKESGSYTLKFRISDSSPAGYDPGFVLDDVVFKRMNDVHVAAGATLDLNGKKDFGDYRFVLDGGTISNTGADISESDAQLANLVLTADSALDVQKSMGMVGSSYAATSIDLGGHTLAVKVASGTFWLFNADVTAGTLDISGAGTVKVDKTGLRARKATLKAGCALNGAGAMTVGNYTASYEGANTGTGKMAVYGVFRPESTGFYNCELQHGATLDLSVWPGEWPLTGVTFASSAAITVSLKGRSDLARLAHSSNPNLVEWTSTSRPETREFSLDRDTARRRYLIHYKMIHDDNATDKLYYESIWIEYKAGTAIIIR